MNVYETAINGYETAINGYDYRNECVLCICYVCIYIRAIVYRRSLIPHRRNQIPLPLFCVYLYVTPLLSHSFAVDVPIVFMQCGHRCRTFFVLSMQNGTRQQGMQPIKQSPAAKHQVMHPV